MENKQQRDYLFFHTRPYDKLVSIGAVTYPCVNLAALVCLALYLSLMRKYSNCSSGKVVDHKHKKKNDGDRSPHTRSTDVTGRSRGSFLSRSSSEKSYGRHSESRSRERERLLTNSKGRERSTLKDKSQMKTHSSGKGRRNWPSVERERSRSLSRERESKREREEGRRHRHR